MRSEKNDFTQGSILKKLAAFMLPILGALVLQAAYGAVDLLVVGRFGSTIGLSAVSTGSQVLNLVTFVVTQLAMGVTVLIARYLGEKKPELIGSVIGGAAVVFTLLSAVLFVVMVGFARSISVLMQAPAEAVALTASYVRICGSGIFFIVAYNLLAAVFRGLGDSKSPLLFVLVACVVNIALDLLFVGVFHMGVGSAAAATAISQLVSMSLCMIRLMRSDRAYRVNLRKIRFDGRALREILQNGLPAGLQNSIISIANVVVQSNINQFGAAAMAGCGAHSRIEGFGFLPVTCFTMALTTFVSQNLGAKAYDRVKKGIRVGIFCSMTIAETIALLIFIFSPKLIGLFTSDAQSIAFGVMHERTTTPFFFLLAYSHCMAAIFRGAGKSTVPMLVMMLCWCIIRVTYVTFAVKFFPVLRTVSWAYPITWGLSTLVFTLYYFKSDWIHAFEKRERRA